MVHSDEMASRSIRVGEPSYTLYNVHAGKNATFFRNVTLMSELMKRWRGAVGVAQGSPRCLPAPRRHATLCTKNGNLAVLRLARSHSTQQPCHRFAKGHRGRMQPSTSANEFAEVNKYRFGAPVFTDDGDE